MPTSQVVRDGHQYFTPEVLPLDIQQEKYAEIFGSDWKSVHLPEGEPTPAAQVIIPKREFLRRVYETHDNEKIIQRSFEGIWSVAHPDPISYGNFTYQMNDLFFPKQPWKWKQYPDASSGVILTLTGFSENTAGVYKKVMKSFVDDPFDSPVDSIDIAWLLKCCLPPRITGNSTIVGIGDTVTFHPISTKPWRVRPPLSVLFSHDERPSYYLSDAICLPLTIFLLRS